MTKNLKLQIASVILLAAAPLAVLAQPTNFFYDDFSTGSTTNGLSIMGGGPTASYTSYDIASGKNTIPGTNGVTIAPRDLKLALSASTSSGWLEAQALFVTNSVGGTNAIVLAEPGDYISMTVVFTNTVGTLLQGSGSALYIGLFNSGGSYPVSDFGLATGTAPNRLDGTASSPYATGNCQLWQGYYAQIANGGTTRIQTRPQQTGSGTTSANQSLVGSGNTGQFNNPSGTTIVTASGNPSFTFNAGGTYTMQLVFTLTAANVMTVSNYLYSGPDTNGTLLIANGSTNISGSTFLTSAFDGFSVGALNKTSGYDPQMDISSISISGHTTVISGPPTITLQPAPVLVATNGSCAFTVNAVGFNISYQWYRNGTNLLDQGNISGATGSGNSSMLVVSPTGTDDVLDSANGYYVVVTGAHGYSTNSVTNSLTLIPATNLVWKPTSGTTWDLNNTANWVDTNNTANVFNFGDPVTFNDVGGGGTVTLSGSYLSAASVTVSNSSAGPGGVYTFSGNGSFAGPGQLIYTGSKGLTLNVNNTYTGGTIISNASARLTLQNYGGLGSGPVTLLQGGSPGLDITIAGAATTGVKGDVVVASDFTVQYDALGSFAAVFLGNISGNSGATLTLLENAGIAGSGTNNRVRVYGISMTNNAAININDSDTVFAPYNPSGVQVYNGLIEGPGSVMQKGALSYFNGANTFSGGTYLTTGYIGLGQSSAGSPDAPSTSPLGTGPLYLWVDSTSANPTGNGGVFSSGGAWTVLNTIEYPSATNNLTFNIGGTNAITFSGSIHLAGNDLANGFPPLYTNRTFNVTNIALTAFTGVIDDLTNAVSANYGLTKTGNGVLALNNTETYTGPTTVSAGTLQVNGSLNIASAVTVSSNATLSGSGNINGPVTVNTAGTLAPGAGSIGAISLNGGLTLAGNVSVRVNRSGSTSDNAVVSGVLTNAGAGIVTVTNLGAALQPGDTFTLFNKPLTNGAVLVVIGGNVAWANQLAANGTIMVTGSPDVGMLSSVQSSVALGLNFTNTLTVTNLGPGTAYSLVVTDALPANVTFVSASGGGTTNANIGQVVWNISSLAATAYTNLTLVLKAATGGNATNIATAVSSAADPALANNSVTNVTLVTTVIVPNISAHIGNISLNGQNVVINGTNGVNGGTYYLLDTTNVAAPLNQWAAVATNIVNTNGASGAFTFTGTNVVTPNSGQQFYILSNTNNH